MKGFTLVELLVVIAIIGVLAAITFPVMSAAKAAGGDTTCRANLRSMGHAATLYALDHDDALPWAPGEMVAWMSRLRPSEFSQLPPVSARLKIYGTTNANLRCPHDFWFGVDPSVGNFERDLRQSFFNKCGSSYRYWVSGPNQVVSLSSDAPSEKLLAGDLYAFHGKEDRFMVVFRDGHADLIPWANLGAVTQ
jgi:prepilin-type N-terminal cleavage/methylation domain-containing protein